MRSNALTYASLVLTTFFWGSSFNVAAHVLQSLPPLSAGSERFAIASVLLLALQVGQSRERWRLIGSHLPMLSVIGFLGVAGFNLAMFYGLRSTTPFNAALVMATTPLWTLLLSALLDGERIERWRGLAVLSGLVGVALVLGAADPTRLAQARLATGDLCILAGALAWALATVLSRRHLGALSAQETSTGTIVLGTAMMLLMASLFEHPLSAVRQASASAHWGLLYMALAGTVIGYLFWFAAAARIGAARTASFFNLVPVFTLLVSLASGLRPQPAQWLGLALVLGGVALASRPRSATVPRRPA